MAIKVKEIMESIQREAREETSSMCEQKHPSTEYYARRMDEYRKQSQLVLMGAGSYGKKLCDVLSAEGLQSKIMCLCDNSASRQGEKYRDWLIYSPQAAYEKYPDAMFIITPKKFEDELIRQLVHLGIAIDKISTFIIAYS